ncbi:MAG: hypothetical protein CMJ59_01260 [Planctomycetaceae bacterium]|nr:hypothetical protein [Planctomycetaceae bacterium]
MVVFLLVFGTAIGKQAACLAVSLWTGNLSTTLARQLYNTPTDVQTQQPFFSSQLFLNFMPALEEKMLRFRETLFTVGQKWE